MLFVWLFRYVLLWHSNKKTLIYVCTWNRVNRPRAHSVIIKGILLFSHWKFKCRCEMKVMFVCLFIHVLVCAFYHSVCAFISWVWCETRSKMCIFFLSSTEHQPAINNHQVYSALHTGCTACSPQCMQNTRVYISDTVSAGTSPFIKRIDSSSRE